MTTTVFYLKHLSGGMLLFISIWLMGLYFATTSPVKDSSMLLKLAALICCLAAGLLL